MLRFNFISIRKFLKNSREEIYKKKKKQEPKTLFF